MKALPARKMKASEVQRSGPTKTVRTRMHPPNVTKINMKNRRRKKAKGMMTLAQSRMQLVTSLSPTMMPILKTMKKTLWQDPPNIER